MSGPFDPFDPGGPLGTHLPLDPAASFSLLDETLPLALFPVRLEARFLPDREPTEIIVRVFPDEIHVDAHDPAFTDTELALAQGYWDWVWRVAAEPAGVGEAREWLAAQLGPHRAVYVAWASCPAADPPAKPTPAGSPLTSPPTLRPVAHRDSAAPGTARLMPLRWAAFIEVADDTTGPFWAANPVLSPLPTTPALVGLPEGAGARDFLDAQGLSWTYDLAAAETAGMVIRIPLAGLPPRPNRGYDRLMVVGVAAGSDHGEAVRTLLDAHRYTRGLELLPPGTPTNVTEDAPEGAGALDVGALFDAEFERRAELPGGRSSAPVPRRLDQPAELLTASPADAVAMAFGLAGQTAADLALAADVADPALAGDTNAALWPATWGKWLTDPMSTVGDDSPLLEREHLDVLRRWFIDFVRAEGPLPTLQAGRHPYGLLPVSVCERRDGSSLFEHLENILLDIFNAWFNIDDVPVLDPDASDITPSTQVAEKASDVGAIYGATPHIRQLRLRPVEDTHRELADLYSLRLGFAGLLCALVPDSDGAHYPSDGLENSPWYQAFLRHENRARGSNGVQGQLDALRAMVNDLDVTPGMPEQEEASLVIRTYINRSEAQPEGHDGGVATGDLLGIVSRHQERVAEAQQYLADLGARDELGTGEAPRLYTAAYGEEGTEVPVDVLVAPKADADAVVDLVGWLEGLRQDVEHWQGGGSRPSYHHTVPVPLLRQLLQSAAASAARGEPAAGLLQGLERLRELVETGGTAAITTLERLLRGTLGLAIYRVDAWMTAFATECLGAERVNRPAGLQVGGYGWLIDVAPRAGRPTQGHIHAPSLDHATTAAVLRSGWSAFGTAEAGSPLAVDLSSGRVRAARSLIEGVRAGQELGRLLGARFERRLHDRHLDRYLDDIRAAVLTGSGQARRPPTRIVDGLLVARAYTDGIERTVTERAVRAALDPIISSSRALRRAVDGTVADLDAVSDLLTAQAVHSLLRGDAGVAAPTLAATGSGDSGLPAVDFPETHRGGRLVTVRVLGLLGHQAVDPVWAGAAWSELAVAEPRLERWVGQLLGDPANVVVEVHTGDGLKRTDLAVLRFGALDAVYRVDQLSGDLLDALGLGAEAAIAAGRPTGLADGQLSWDEFLALARAARTFLGRIRALTSADLAVESDGAESRDLADLQARLAKATELLPIGDPRHLTLRQHRADHPVDTVDLVIERLRIVTVHPVPILPLLIAGIPKVIGDSFAARESFGGTAAWLVQAAKVRPALDTFLRVVQMAELVAGRALLSLAVAQTPDTGGPWAGIGTPSAPGSHTAWCNVTGVPESGPIAGYVVDAWTETIPAQRIASGIAVHFDRPSARAPNAILLVVTRPGQRFDLDFVQLCVRDTMVMAQFRALSSDAQRAFFGQFLPAVFLPGDAAILSAGPGESP